MWKKLDDICNPDHYFSKKWATARGLRFLIGSSHPIGWKGIQCKYILEAKEEIWWIDSEWRLRLYYSHHQPCKIFVHNKELDDRLGALCSRTAIQTKRCLQSCSKLKYVLYRIYLMLGLIRVSNKASTCHFLGTSLGSLFQFRKLETVSSETWFQILLEAPLSHWDLVITPNSFHSFNWRNTRNPRIAHLWYFCLFLKLFLGNRVWS